MRLIEPVAKSFKVAKTFKENTDKINHINYSQNGDSLISSCDDDQIVIYDCVAGTPKRSLNSKKYGVSLIQFTHSINNAIHGSTKIDDTIRYLSLHDNKYIRYFLGHSKKVVSLCMSPVDDTFLSGALDKTIRLWDLRSQNCQGLMHVTGRPVAAFDPEGLIFAAGINSESIKLYDLRSFDKGPFTSFKLAPEAPGVEWTSLKFSPDGKMVLIGTNSNVVRLVDAFKGTQLHGFSGYHNPNQLTLESSFTPDSQFVLAGAADGRIHVWNSDTGSKVTVLHPYDQQSNPVYCCRFNPKYMMLSSASTNMSFWLPYIDE